MLCDPLPTIGHFPVLAETGVQLQLVMRYAADETDMPAIAELLKEEISSFAGLPSSLESFKEMLSSFAASSVSQAFIVKLGDHILFEIEVRKAEVHLFSLGDFIPEKGDYCISLLAGGFNKIGFPLYIRGLQLCLDYFWKFAEVHRIVASISTGAIEENKARLFTATGLEGPVETAGPGGSALFLLSRNS